MEMHKREVRKQAAGYQFQLNLSMLFLSRMGDGKLDPLVPYMERAEDRLLDELYETRYTHKYALERLEELIEELKEAEKGESKAKKIAKFTV